MHRNMSADVHQFAMVPRPEIPRSSFRIQKAHKTTFDSSYLVPIYLDEVLPGDTFNLNMTAFVRMATPIFPIMDNLRVESFFFFVPNRLLWTNWVKFMGQQTNPADSISFTIPTVTSPAGGWAVGGLNDHLGLPVVGQIGGGNTITVNALPRRAYYTIWNEWFRDENLVNSVTVSTGDGPDGAGDGMLRRGKRHDYFTSALPWTQKGGIAVSIPLGTSAIVTTASSSLTTPTNPLRINKTGGGNFVAAKALGTQGTTAFENVGSWETSPTPTGTFSGIAPTNLFADLSTATAATINQLRQAFQIQKLLERDARGGTRYTEIIQAHFGVKSPDARLQRPEYLGGGSSPIQISPVAQTSAVAAAPTPLGSLSAFGTAVGTNHGFTQSFTEHGYILGLVNVTADLTYQQGIRRLWNRSTRYDFYFPAFAFLGEQAILNKEIFADGSANDLLVFGYAERWAEYRYNPSEITGLFRSTSAGTLDGWHLSQRFTVLPTLNSTFISDVPPISRVVAAGAASLNAEFLADFFFDIKAARPLPLYSVPGLIDHF